MSDERPWHRRAPWLRLALFGVFLGSLPFTWTEETSSGCGGPPRAPIVKSGWALISHEPQALILVVALTLCPLLLLFVADDVRSGVRAAAHAAAAVASAGLGFLLFFAATFTLFARIRLFAPAFLGLGCLVLATLEALARSVGELIQLVRERRRRPRE
ncbi:MAG: hypothetical protein IT377_24845 [Polyangiaceae bacterium]|nr:hypothetical protein [Polyangiaceae bacterium]